MPDKKESEDEKCTCRGTRFCGFCIDSERVLKRRNPTKNHWSCFDCYVLKFPSNNECYLNKEILPTSTVEEIYDEAFQKDTTLSNPEISSIETEKCSISGITLIPDFLNEEEEIFLDGKIKETKWIPSQSGRQKQDFGPQVNFKGQKVKIGEFKGMPRYVDLILQKIQNFSERYPQLSDFQLFELCNLEYDRKRLSSIDFHKDDAWIWGDRLISISLIGDSVMTFEDSENQRLVFVPMPRRSLLCIGDEARYRLNHGIFPHHIEKRVVITMREPAAEFQVGGQLFDQWGRELQSLANKRIN